MSIFLTIFLAGVFACIILDLWQIGLQRLVGIPATNWGVVGRWLIVGLGTGRFVNDQLDDTATIKNEAAAGWTLHYAVSIGYGVIYAVLMYQTPWFGTTWLDGIYFGAASVVVPWFIFLPCMGKGILARKTPNPVKVCGLALAAHIIFGVAMAFGFGLFGT
ncbi:DUF2938 family protein [Candidatus Puniceispirillum marinum]|uniref:DUF2938 domain-containing protein n=1 Tax=Puniceispirillum marinum (strain IMCC1322) TaxID=488538 RepID=D5BQG2_PUNMI|nr:DUF2938 family protein [Candidatus Puniceispirillum marinum]ADE40680.1 hypothetical protein SAR116_2437 [Candidatus Puniceispirillum marinum IMCC1322]